MNDKFVFEDDTSDVLSTEKDKGGRPPIEESKKKNKRISIYFTDEEYKKIVDNASEIPISTFTRSLVISKLNDL